MTPFSRKDRVVRAPTLGRRQKLLMDLFLEAGKSQIKSGGAYPKVINKGKMEDESAHKKRKTKFSHFELKKISKNTWKPSKLMAKIENKVDELENLARKKTCTKR